MTDNATPAAELTLAEYCRLISPESILRLRPMAIRAVRFASGVADVPIGCPTASTAETARPPRKA